MESVAAIERLLVEAKTAHGDYERTQLNGVYDEEWPRWYSGFLIEHGLAEAVGRAVNVDQLAALLAESWEVQQRSAATKTQTWESFTARHLGAQLGGTPPEG
jgi:hypothetical protein